MKVQILGAHNVETDKARLPSLLVDDVLAIDAGGLISSLSLSAQERVRAVLITHHHFDHVRDLVILGMNAASWAPVKVYALRQTLDIVNSCLLDGRIYVNFAEFPSKENPSLQLQTVEPHKEQIIEGYRVLPLPVNHTVPAVCYQVISPDGKNLFYSGDTGPELAACWEYVSPQLLIVEVSGINKFGERLRGFGHLSAQLLQKELIEFRRLKGYLPPIVIVHIAPQFEKEIEGEVSQVARELGANISMGYEGMKITF